MSSTLPQVVGIQNHHPHHPHHPNTPLHPHGLDVHRLSGDDVEARRARPCRRARPESAALHSSADDPSIIDAPHSLTHSDALVGFGFPYQDPARPSPVVHFQDSTDGTFALPQSDGTASVPDRRLESAGSITVQAPSLATATATAAAAAFSGRPGLGNLASNDASPDTSSQASANPLEEPMPDEFGLAADGPAEAGSADSKVRPDKPHSAPPWSELRTKAGKERKRLPLACIACRRKKIRCSGEKPACKHCLRSRIPCVYKATPRKAAPRTDYMAMLDKRLKRMEERIIKIVPRADQDPSASSVTRAVVKPAIPSTHAGDKRALRKRGAPDAFGADALGADLDRWARRPLKPKVGLQDNPASLMTREAGENKLWLEGTHALPPKDIQEHLAEVFFDNIYGQAYYLLHKPSYMRKLRAGTLPPVLVLSVCAVAARFSNHPRLNTSPQFLRGEEWASVARDILVKRYEWPSVTTLTCLLIMGLHEFGTCHGGRSWALGGQATRMAFALQLHKDWECDPLRADGQAPLSFIDREIRRRTMWACFVMDRFNSSGTDRPTFIVEETLKIPLPVKEKCFQLDMPCPTETLNGDAPHPIPSEDGEFADAKGNMGVSAYTVRAVAIWGRVVSYLSREGKDSDPHPMWSPESRYAELTKQVEEFLASLPAHLVYTSENLKLHDTENMANHFLFFHITVQQNILFMNRFAVFSPTGASLQDLPKPFVSKAGAQAFQAANHISELLNVAESYFVTAPFVGYCAFLSGTVHILGIFSGNPAMEAASRRGLAINVRFLSRMKRYWGMFHWMLDNLRDQYRACADAARQGTTTTRSSSSQVFQYGDWFDRYPHGVSGAGPADPANYQQKKGSDAVLEQKPELHTVEEYFNGLSPESTETASGAAGRKPQKPRRKSVAARSKGTASSRSGLEPDPIQPSLTDQPADQAQVRAPSHRSHPPAGSGPRTEQASHPTPPPSRARATRHANGNPYKPVSPLSPMPVPQFAATHQHYHHQPPHADSSFFPDPVVIAAAAHQPGLAPPQLDRQLVFGAYGHPMVPSFGGSWPGWAGAAHSGQLPAGERRDNNDNGGGGGGGQTTLFQEPSSAWFVPFNLEPPDLGTDVELGTGVDGLADVFGVGSVGVNDGTHFGTH